ncbi:MAG: aldehyde dehydrogenase family protein [Phycisphaerae bacterium]
MLHIPILRNGQPYESADKVEILHHATGEVVAQVSQANSGMIVRDVRRMNSGVLESFSTQQLIDLARVAGKHFIEGTLPCGDVKHSFDDYVRHLSATTGSPISYCKRNAEKIFKIFDDMALILAGLMRGLPYDTIDKGYAKQDGRTVSYFRAGRIFGAVLPSNSPGVHSLWTPAICLKAPIVLKPGREEPWTPLRIIEAYKAAGVPAEAFGFYPTDHAGAGELLRVVDRSMLFGDAKTTAMWKDDPRVELHGPGWSKVALGDDCVEDWPKYVDLIASSISANGGRSCINASSVWTPKYGRAIAEALAEKFAAVQALPADDPNAVVSAFANPVVPESINAQIDAGLREPGAEDVTLAKRGGPRFVKNGRVGYLLPTVVWVDPKLRGESGTDYKAHPLSDREYLFPYASVIECPTRDMPCAVGQTLVFSAITNDRDFAARLMAAGNIDRLNIGAIPTWQLSWDQPHEGNLFEHLYRQRAFQMEEAA